MAMFFSSSEGMNSWPSLRETEQGHHKQHDRDGDDRRWCDHGEAQQRAIGAFGCRNKAVLALLHATGEADRNQRRHQRQRQHKRGAKREDHGERHRLEHLALHAGEGEKRHIDEQDDRLSVEAGPDHFDRGGAHGGKPLLARQQTAKLALPLAQDGAGCSR